MNDIKIFVSSRIDGEYEWIKNSIYFPVRCGAIFDKAKDSVLPGDDSGENISDKRKTYNELTVLYWAWKNASSADYMGLCHYRRYFSFSNNKKPTDVFGTVFHSCLDENAVRDYCLNDMPHIRESIQKYDIILAQEYRVEKTGFKSLLQQYGQAPHLHIQDLECALQVIKKKYPEYYETAVSYLNGTCFYPCNMFIMRKEIFNRYCEWLFSILFEVEKSISIDNYSAEGQRAIGMIAERLLGIFCLYEASQHNAKLGVLQRVFFQNPQQMIVPQPYFGKNNIPILLASSEAFLPYLCVTMQSIVHNGNDAMNYDFLVLHSDICAEAQAKAKLDMQQFNNAKVRFVDVSPLIGSLKFHSNAHLAQQAFYRLMMLKLLKNYDKVIYLDCDLIVLGDISELFSLDMGEKLIAAVKDADFIGQYCGANLQTKEYVENVLHLETPLEYFQAGVLLLNITALKSAFEENELVDLAVANRFAYCDQDVLNIKCGGRIMFLDMVWNVLVDCGGFRIQKVISFAPVWLYDQYALARQSPKIIHYAGYEKPWENPSMDMACFFWEYARKSRFYEEILYLNIQKKGMLPEQKKGQLKEMLKKLFPLDSKRGHIALMVYSWLKHALKKA